MSTATTACTPWYAKFDIKSEQELTAASSLPKLNRAILSEHYCFNRRCQASCALCAIEALERHGPQAVPILVRGLKHPKQGVRQAARVALTKLNWKPEPKLESGRNQTWFKKYGIQTKEDLHSTASVLKLKKAVESDEDCRQALLVLAKIGQPAVKVIVVALNHRFPNARMAAVQALGKIRASEAVPSLVKMFGDNSSGVRVAAIHALNAIGATEALPAMVKALGDDSSAVRIAAVRTIPQIGVGNEMAIRALKQAKTEDPDPTIRAAAAKAHRKMSFSAIASKSLTGNPSLEKSHRSKNQPVVAIFDIQDSSQNLKNDVLAQLTEYLAAKVTQVAKYKVVPRSSIRKRLGTEKRETYKQCYDQTCQIEIGRELAAQKSLATKILRVGKRCAITSTLFDLKSATTEKAATVQTDCSKDSLMGGMDDVAGQLAGRK